MDKEEKSQVPVPTNDSFIIYESLAITQWTALQKIISQAVHWLILGYMINLAKD